MKSLTIAFLALSALGGSVFVTSSAPMVEAAALDAEAAVSSDRAMAPIRDESAPSKAYLGGRNLPSHGVALEGYCPVAYFAADKPLRGKPEHSSVYDGVTYYFVSAAAKRAFDAEPEKYVPAYGGWCAFGMSTGNKFPVDPLSFEIVDGRLMLFLKNPGVDARKLWNRGDAAESTRKADAHWEKIRG